MGKMTPYGEVDDLGVHAVPAPGDDFEPLDDFEPIEEEPTDAEKLYGIFNAAYDAPDDHTKALAVSERTGLPANLVKGQVREWERHLARAGNDVEKFMERSPKLAAAILRKPELAPAVVKDQSWLEKLEDSFKEAGQWAIGLKAFKGLTDVDEITALRSKKGDLQSRVESVAVKRWKFDRGVSTVAPTEAEEREAAELEEEIRFVDAVAPEGGFITGMPGAAMENLWRYLRSLGEIGKYAAYSAEAGAAAGAAWGVFGGPAAPVTAPAGATAGFLAGLTAGMVGGGYKVASEAEAAMFYRDGLRKKIDKAVLGPASDWVGVVNGITEVGAEAAVTRFVPGMGRVIKDKLGRQVMEAVIDNPSVQSVLLKAGAQFGQGMGIEGATEVAQTVFPLAVDARIQGKSWGQTLATVYDDFFAPYPQSEIRQSFVGGAQGGGGMFALSPFMVMEKVGEIRDAQRAQSLLKEWEARAEAVQGSEVFAELKGAGRDLAKQFIQQYGKSNAVAISASKLAEFFSAEGLSQEEVAALLPGVARQISVDPSGEVVIKSTDFLTKVLTRKGAEKLLPDLREGDLPTAEEAKEVEKRATEVLKEVAEREERLVTSNEEIAALEAKRQDAQEALDKSLNEEMEGLTPLRAPTAEETATATSALEAADAAQLKRATTLKAADERLAAAQAAGNKAEIKKARDARNKAKKAHEAAVAEYRKASVIRGEMDDRAAKLQGREQEIEAYSKRRADLTAKVREAEKKIADARRVMETQRRKGDGLKVFETVRNQLIALKHPKLPPAAATKIAALWQAFIETRSARLGVGVEEYVRGLNLTFQRGEWGDLTKKDQGKALAQTEDGDFTFYRPDMGVYQPTLDPNFDANEKARRAALAAEVERKKDAEINPADFTLWRPGENAPPVQPQERPAPTEAEIKERDAAWREKNPSAGKIVADAFAELADHLERIYKGETETLEQKSGEAVKGFFQTNPLREFFKITFGGKADMSTFVHETGHAFLAILERDAAFHPQSAEDLAAVKKWLGAGKRTTKDQYEKFARGFEGFVWEGKAPSERLADVFRSLMGFMRKIYATLRKLDAPLTDEVRDVMDRLLATDIEIQMAREKLGVLPLPNKDGLFTPEEDAAYRAPFEVAYAAAKAKADRQTLRAWKETIGKKREQITQQVEAAADNDKALNAREVLLTGKRLDGAEVKAPLRLGEMIVKPDRAWVKENGLKDPALNKFTQAGGLDPDIAAMVLGYDSGMDLMNALLATPSRETWVRQEIERRMGEEFPGYKNNQAWQQENAYRALHAAEIGNAIWAGMVAMSKKLGGKLGPTAKQAIKLAAERRVAEMTVLEMRPGAVVRQEARAAREAAEAWKAGDVRAALVATRAQLFYHHLWREVDVARKEIKDISDYFASFKETDKRKRLARGDDRFLKAIESILATIDFGQQMETGVKLHEILQALRDEGLPVLPPSPSIAKEFDSMALGDLRSVQESIQNLEHLAKEATEAFLSGEKASFAETVAGVSNAIRENMQTTLPAAAPKGGLVPGNRYGWAKVKGVLDSLAWHLKKIEFMARVLDGGKTAGYVHSKIFQPLADAEAAEHTLFREVFVKLRDEFKRLPLMERMRHDKGVAFLGREYAYRDVFMIALNMRNEGNMSRLMKQFGWTKEEIVARLDEVLTAEDVTLINKIGDLVESLWPRVVQVYKNTYGIEPKRVIGEDVVLPNKGTIKGGYFPIMKDPHARKTKPDPLANDLWDEGFVSAVVGHGFTENRADNADTPLAIDLDALPHHIMKVIHYVTHYEATRKVDRLLRDPAVQSAIEDSLSQEAYKEIRPWLLNIVHGQDTGAEVVGAWDAMLRYSRVGAGIVLMGGRLTTAMVQTLGLTMTAKELATDQKTGRTSIFSGAAAKYMTLGIWQFMQDFTAWTKGGPSPFKAIEAVNSSWILHRENYDRDLRLEYRRLTSALAEAGHARGRVAEMAMFLFNLVQGTVNAITWHAALRKAQDEGHAAPADYANSVIRMSQSSGGAKDLAGIQRGPEWKKVFTVLYSFGSVVFNALTEAAPKGLSPAQKVSHKVAQAWWVVLLPAILATLMRGDEDETEDPEAFFKGAGTEALMMGARSVPVVGDAARALVGWDAKQAPWIDFFVAAAKPIGKATGFNDAEITDKDVEALINALGVATHIPTKAGIEIVDYLSQLKDMEDPGLNAFFRPRHNWR